MTDEERRKLTEVYDYIQQRKKQQLSYPVDDASRNALGVATRVGPGSTTLTQSISLNLSGDAETKMFNIPRAFVASLIISIEGANYEIPILS